MSETCENMREDLVAFAWEKLEGDARGEIERHVESCDECRAELEKIRSVRAAVRSAAEIEPTGGFHARVMSRLKQRMTPRGLPAAGPASRRLALLAERDRPRVFTPRQKVIAFLCSAATAAVVMLALQAWKIAVREPAEPVVTYVDDRSEGRIVMARWRERKECERREALSEAATIDVAGILDDGEVVLTGVVDVERHERCLMAFRASEWDEYVRLYGNPLAARERARFREMDSNRRTATVRGGRLEVPQAMLDRYVGGTAEVVVLRLRDRAEIWSRDAYGIYRRRMPEIVIDPRDVTALECPRPKRDA